MLFLRKSLWRSILDFYIFDTDQAQIYSVYWRDVKKLRFVGKDLLHEDEVQEQDREQRQDPQHHPRLPLQVDFLRDKNPQSID